METKVIDLAREPRVAGEETSRSTLANGFAMASAVMRELIGVELSRSKEIDLDDYMRTAINNQVYAKINTAAKDTQNAA